MHKFYRNKLNFSGLRGTFLQNPTHLFMQPTHRPQILIAPNALKHSVRALDAAEAIRRGMTRSRLKADYHLSPLADGGDGTSQVLTRCLGGTFRATRVLDPLGREVTAHYGWINDRQIAILEMAEASGIQLLSTDERNPMEASSFGTGQLIKAAIAEGAKEIWLGIGGSATVDGGLGAMAALGVRTLDAEGNPITAGGQGMQTLHRWVMPEEHPFKAVKVRVLCDVNFPLLGPKGAARMFGPQKGASRPMVKALDHGLKHLSQLIEKETGQAVGSIDHGGAAGGIGVVLSALLGAELHSGSQFIIEQLGLPEKLKHMDFVITAEGRLDSQSLGGKAPAMLARQAKAAGAKVIALAGQIQDRPEVDKLFDAVYPVNPEWKSTHHALEMGEEHLTWAAEQVGRLLYL